MKASEMFDSYLKSICKSNAQFEAVSSLHRIYFEDQDCECGDDDCNCDGKPCDGAKCECDGETCGDAKCECGGACAGDCTQGNEKMINESTDVVDDGISDGESIDAAAKANDMSNADYDSAVSLFVS